MFCFHTEGKYHDCKYVDWRNKFVDKAEKYANLTVPKIEGSINPSDALRDKYNRDWSRAFHARMSILTERHRDELL